MNLEYILFGVFVAWLLVLSILTAWIFYFFRKLSKNVGKGNLIKVIGKVLDSTKVNAKKLKDLEKELANFKEEGTYHVQKVALVRFNPFNEMGGDYSFSLVLLNGNNTGFIITSLHTRERTRVYIKDVKKGRVKMELSKEERKALDKARKGK
jgi:hypothetical protein